MVKNRILDFEELNDCLDKLKLIRENAPIGMTHFGYPIRHFTYGSGENHVIISGGTHATELISNHYVIHLMELLEKDTSLIDKEKYTIHFIPILNPEGTIVLTSAIRAKLKKDFTYEEEQAFCKKWYLCCKFDDETGNRLKRKYKLFRDVDATCIDEKHTELRKVVSDIMSSFPDGSIIQWAANGRGVNLNDNSPANEYIKLKENGVPRYMNGQNEGLNLSMPNPLGTIYRDERFTYEKENESLLEFYRQISSTGNLIGSIIYHSCGGLVRYLKGVPELKNPWRNELSEEEIQYNENVAATYTKSTGYRMLETKAYNTISSKLESTYPGTILVELGQIRGNPFGQFINDNGLFDKILSTNDLAIRECIEVMYREYHALQNFVKKH